MSENPNERQVGGDHYRRDTQHWDLVWEMHGEGYFLGNITKYTERHAKKNKRADLEKALHYAEKLATFPPDYDPELPEADAVKLVKEYCDEAELTFHQRVVFYAAHLSPPLRDNLVTYCRAHLEHEYPESAKGPMTITDAVNAMAERRVPRQVNLNPGDLVRYARPGGRGFSGLGRVMKVQHGIVTGTDPQYNGLHYGVRWRDREYATAEMCHIHTPADLEYVATEGASGPGTPEDGGQHARAQPLAIGDRVHYLGDRPHFKGKGGTFLGSQARTLASGNKRVIQHESSTAFVMFDGVAYSFLGEYSSVPLKDVVLANANV